jgi:hypothetical protein
MREWLDSSLESQVDKLDMIQNSYSRVIQSFAKFNLQALPEASKFELPQSLDNPLIIAINAGHHQIVAALIRAGAPINEAMVQFAINSNILLNHMLNAITDYSSEHRAAYEDVLGNVIVHNDKSDSSPPLLNAEMTQKMVNLLSGNKLSALLAQGVTHSRITLMAALLQHPCMNSTYLLQGDAIRSTSSIFVYAKYKGNKPMIDLIKNALIKEVYESAINGQDDSYQLTADRAEVTQREVVDYILAKAKALPPIEKSIGLIFDEIKRLETPSSHLHYFLRGYVLSRLRTGLIEDLQKEMNSRQAALAPKPENTPIQETGESSRSAATANTVTFLARGNSSTAASAIKPEDRKIAALEARVNLNHL